MKKSNFVAMILGVISFGFFALGMCMALLPQWNVFTPGVISGCIGMVFAVITVLVWRKMENKSPIHINGRTIITISVGIIGSLFLGVGMCMTMLWSLMVGGIALGMIGIIILLCLIPLIKGIE